MTDITNRELTPEANRELQDAISADILRIERESRKKAAPKTRRTVKCGCTSTWVCLKYQGEA